MNPPHLHKLHSEYCAKFHPSSTQVAVHYIQPQVSYKWILVLSSTPPLHKLQLLYSF